MVTVKKKRLVNPEKKIGSPRAARSHPKANPGALFVLGAVNPHKGKTTMTKSKSKKKKQQKPARPNPFQFFGKKAKGLQKQYKPKKRRNPEFLENGLKTPIDVIKFGILAALGFYGTRQIPQWILKSKNQGIWGYLANLVTASGLGLGTNKFVSKQAGNAVMIGGGLYLVNRFAVEQFAPVGNVLKLAGVGDATAAGTLGKIKDAYFPVPIVRDKQGNPIIPKEIDAQSVRQFVVQQLQQGKNASASGVSGVSRASAVSHRMKGRLAA